MVKKRRVLPQKVNGVQMPPRKKFIRPKKYVVLRFSWAGIVPAKKNRQVPDRNVKKIRAVFNAFKSNIGKTLTAGMVYELQQQILEIKPFIRPSKKFQEWVDLIKPVMLEQAAKWKKTYERKGLTFPITRCSVSVYHYWRDDKRRDGDNRLETINDLLVLCGIIADDSWQCLRKQTSESDIYKDEILQHLHDITVCAYNW